MRLLPLPLLFPFLPRLLMLLVTVAVASPSQAAPQRLYDNLGDLGDVYEDTDIFSLIGDHSAGLGGADWYQGFRFIPQETGLLQSIDVAVGHLDAPETIEFRLYADAGGTLGALIETIFVQTSAENFDGAIEAAPAAGTTQLLAGTSYWLMATGDGPTIWFQNEIGVSLPRLWTPGGPGAPLSSDTTTASAFRMNGPEPVPLTGLWTRILLVAVLTTLMAAVGMPRARGRTS